MIGTIQDNGLILATNGKLYPPDIIHCMNGRLTILLAMSSITRYSIEDVKGKKVRFSISRITKKGYNFRLLDKH